MLNALQQFIVCNHHDHAITLRSVIPQYPKNLGLLTVPANIMFKSF